MPRAPRIQFEGAFYHVYHRGNRRERIFLDDQDYAKFERLLLEAAAWSGVRLFDWSQLPNHFHMVVETPDGNLSEFMSRLLTGYAKYFNWRHNFVGHVFQGRYGAKLCDKDKYFLELLRYVELNAYRTKGAPLAAIGSWKWSSHRYLMMPESQWPAVMRQGFEEVLGRFGDEMHEARRRYTQFLADGLANGNWEDFYKIKANQFLGDDSFVEKTKRRAEQPIRQEERKHRKLRSVSELLEIITRLSGCEPGALSSPSREKTLSQWRQALVQVGRKIYRFPVKTLADAIGRDASAASQILRRGAKMESLKVDRLMEELTAQSIDETSTQIRHGDVDDN